MIVFLRRKENKYTRRLRASSRKARQLNNGAGNWGQEKRPHINASPLNLFSCQAAQWPLGLSLFSDSNPIKSLTATRHLLSSMNPNIPVDEALSIESLKVILR